MPESSSELKLCQCGCGNPAPIVKTGCFKGQQCNYIAGHNLRHPGGKEHPHWKGGRIIVNGYAFVKRHGHPRAHPVTGYLLEHLLIAEKAYGGPLPLRAVVHHVNEAKADNRHSNLVICEDLKYHNLLHQRTRALHAFGSVEARKCWICKTYDEPGNLAFTKAGICHIECRRNRSRLNKKRRAV